MRWHAILLGLLLCARDVVVLATVPVTAVERAYWEARTASALALRPGRRRPAPAPIAPPAKTTPQPAADERPEVILYVPTFACPACERAKADAAAGKLPFRLTPRTTGPNGEGVSIPVTSWPTFHWRSPDGRWWRFDGYDGAEAMAQRWRKTMTQGKEARDDGTARQPATDRGSTASGVAAPGVGPTHPPRAGVGGRAR